MWRLVGNGNQKWRTQEHDKRLVGALAEATCFRYGMWPPARLGTTSCRARQTALPAFGAQSAPTLSAFLQACTFGFPCPPRWSLILQNLVSMWMRVFKTGASPCVEKVRDNGGGHGILRTIVFSCHDVESGLC